MAVKWQSNKIRELPGKLLVAAVVMGWLVLYGWMSVQAARGRLLPEARFVGNRASGIVHCVDCPYAQRMAPANRVPFRWLEDAIEAGYRPCRRCRAPIPARHRGLRSAQTEPLDHCPWSSRSRARSSHYGNSEGASR